MFCLSFLKTPPQHASYDEPTFARQGDPYYCGWAIPSASSQWAMVTPLQLWAISSGEPDVARGSLVTYKRGVQKGVESKQVHSNRDNNLSPIHGLILSTMTHSESCSSRAVTGTVTLLEKLKDEVSWWGVIMGDSGAITSRWETLKGWGFRLDRAGGAKAAKGGDLEGSLNALADTLGISPVQVASAVKPLIPMASLTSIGSKETGGSEAVRILYEDTTRDGRDRAGTTGVAEEPAERPEKG